MTPHNNMHGTLHQVSLEGDLTIYAAAELKQRLLVSPTDGGAVEIDLSGVGEVDAAGLQLLILAKREAARHGRDLRLVGHSPAILDVLELCNLHGYFGDPVVLPSKAA